MYKETKTIRADQRY